MDAPANNQTLEERIYNISDLNKQSDSGGTDLQHFRPKFRNCFNSILSRESRGCPKKSWIKVKTRYSNFPVNDINAAEKINLKETKKCQDLFFEGLEDGHL